jgi:hypothetical protein
VIVISLSIFYGCKENNEVNNKKTAVNVDDKSQKATNCTASFVYVTPSGDSCYEYSLNYDCHNFTMTGTIIFGLCNGPRYSLVYNAQFNGSKSSPGIFKDPSWWTHIVWADITGSGYVPTTVISDTSDPNYPTILNLYFGSEFVRDVNLTAFINNPLVNPPLMPGDDYGIFSRFSDQIESLYICCGYR